MVMETDREENSEDKLLPRVKEKLELNIYRKQDLTLIFFYSRGLKEELKSIRQLNVVLKFIPAIHAATLMPTCIALFPFLNNVYIMERGRPVTWLTSNHPYSFSKDCTEIQASMHCTVGLMDTEEISSMSFEIPFRYKHSSLQSHLLIKNPQCHKPTIS